MKNIFLDTNIFIAADKKQDQTLIELIELQIQGEVQLFVNAIVVFEYLYGIKKTKKIEKAALKKFEVIEFVEDDFDIAVFASRLAQKQSIGTADTMIVSLCLEHNFYLATLNQKHFKTIPNLKLWSEK